jgi:hypothetical protein
MHWDNKILHREKKYVNTHIQPANEICEHWAPEVLLVGAGGVPGCGGIGTGVGAGLGSLCRLDGGAPVLLRLQCVSGIFVLPFCQERRLAVWLWPGITGCHSIAAFAMLCPGNSTPCFFSSRTLAQGVLIRYNVFCIAAHKNPCLQFCWPYSRPGACWTVLAVHNHLALPPQQIYWIPTRN